MRCRGLFDRAGVGTFLSSHLRNIFCVDIATQLTSTLSNNMPRSYHTAAAAFAIGRPVKWLDSVLSRYDIAGVSRQTRGLARAIPADALLILRITSDLCGDLDLSVP